MSWRAFSVLGAR